MRECTEQDQIVSSAAYILFYQRRGINFDHIDYEMLRNRLDTTTSSEGGASCSSHVNNKQEHQEAVTTLINTGADKKKNNTENALGVAEGPAAATTGAGQYAGSS